MEKNKKYKSCCLNVMLITIYKDNQQLGTYIVLNSDILISYRDDNSSVTINFENKEFGVKSFKNVNVAIATTNDPNYNFAGDTLNLGCHSFVLSVENCDFDAMHNGIVIRSKQNDIKFDIHRPLMKRVIKTFENGN